MSEHVLPVVGWQPLTLWNVGAIGTKRCLMFTDRFSTAGLRSKELAQWQIDAREKARAIEQARLAARRTKPSVTQLMERYGI